MSLSVKFLLKIPAYYLFQIVRIVPRSKTKWVFGYTHGFLDNSQNLFYFTLEHHPEIRPIWIGRSNEEVRYVRSKGYEAYHRYWSLKGIFHILTSEVFICSKDASDINTYLSGGAFLLNLWHGVGLKKIKWLSPYHLGEHYGLKTIEEMESSWKFKIGEFVNLFRKPQALLVPSSFQAESIFIPSFKIEPSKIIYTIYPRNKVLIMSEQDRTEYIKKYDSDAVELISKLREYKKIYIYMPTWRNDGKDFITESQIVWLELSKILIDTNSLLILKLHPHTKITINNEFPNIINFPHNVNIYSILPYTDCLITDYSSIYCDYILMKKEVILFTFDYESYIKNSYEILDYDTYYCGKKIDSFNNLLKTIRDNEDCHLSQEEYDFVLNAFWDSAFNDLDIVEEIKNRINYN